MFGSNQTEATFVFSLFYTWSQMSLVCDLWPPQQMKVYDPLKSIKACWRYTVEPNVNLFSQQQQTTVDKAIHMHLSCY